MVPRFHSWWKLIKKFRAVLISSVVVILIALVIAGYVFNLDWMGLNGYSTTSVITDLSSKKMTRTEYFLPGKTFWDWMQLLFVPSVLTLGAVWFTARQNHDREIAHEQHKNDRDIAIDNQREAELQAYIDKMSELLLVNDLRESTEDAEVRKIVRVRTLTVLHRLDAERKGSVLRFLYESGLIDKGKRIIDLSGANLSGANLSHVDLGRARLVRANLSGAIVTPEQLDKAWSLKDSILPGGAKHSD